LQGASDHHGNDDNNNSKDIMDGQKPSLETDQSVVTSEGSAANPYLPCQAPLTPLEGTVTRILELVSVAKSKLLTKMLVQDHQ